jgi:outer membrane protein assembly factor BamE (lipoprotein component of BamABCDE complex)
MTKSKVLVPVFKLEAQSVTKLHLLICVLLATSIAGCTNTPPQNSIENSPYTHGNVQLTLKKGETTQAEVLNKFGAPNITTIDATGQEVWTYQKHATVANTTRSGSYASIIVAGVGNGTSGFEQSSRTLTLIITFDKTNKVTDFKSMSSSF